MSSSSIKSLIGSCNKTTLLKDLIWPAVAGNVAWTFFSVLIKILQPGTVQVEPDQGPVVRLIAIFLLSCYLGIVYLMSCHEATTTGHSKKRNWFDISHSLTIIFCAIAFQPEFETKFCKECLTVFWIVAAIGHLAGAWIPDSVVKAKYWKRIGMATISFLGIALCWAFSTFLCNWNIVISLFAGLILWGSLRRWLYSE